MRKRLLQIFRIDPSEAWFVQSFFFHHFFQGLGLALFFVTASVIFLSRFSVLNLPLVYVSSAAFMLLGGQIYSNLQHYISLERIMQGIMLLIAISIIVLLSGIGDYAFLWFVFLLLIWYRVIYLFSNFESWALAAVLFQARSTQKNLGWLTIGDLPGMIVGYFSAPLLLSLFNNQQVMAFSAAAFLAAFFFLRRIIKKEAYAQIHEENQESRMEVLKTGPAISKFFSNSSIIGLCFLSLIVITLTIWLDFALLSNLQQYFHTESKIAWFLGIVFGVISLLSFVAKMIFSRRLISELGIKRALFTLPIVMLILSVFLLFPELLPGYTVYKYFIHLCIIMLAFTSLRYALQRPVFLTLLQPLVARFRFQGYNLMKGVIEPASVGIAGGTLWLLYHWQIELDNELLSWLINSIVVVWLVNIILFNKSYIGILKTAVDVRSIKGSELAIQDKKILEVLESKLETGKTEEVIYSIEFLQKFNKDNLIEKLHVIINHPSDDVKIHALAKIGELQLQEFEDELLQIIEGDDTAPIVKAESIKAVCSLNKDRISELKKLLKSEHESISRAVLLCMYLYGDVDEQKQADMVINKYAWSLRLEDNLLAVRIIRDLGEADYIKIIDKYLDDERTELVICALEATAILKHEALVPKLLHMVEHHILHNEALRSLTEYGEQVLPHLKQAFGEADSSRGVYFMRLCRICGKIGGAEAYEILWWVTSYQWIELQSEALNALQMAGYDAVKYKQLYYVADSMENLFRRVFWLYNALELLANKNDFALLKEALEKELSLRLQHARVLVSFLFAKDGEKYKNILNAMGSIEKTERSKAFENLNQMLPHSTVERLSILFGNENLSTKVNQLSRYYNNDLLDEITVVLMILRGTKRGNHFTRWTQAAALYSLTGSFYPSLLKTFLPYIEGEDELLKEAAMHTIKAFCEDRLFSYEEIFAEVLPHEKIQTVTKFMREQEELLLEIEKIIVLKSTSIFSETPESVLSDIASILKEQNVSAGDAIFKKGDPGDCMYIIYEGQVKIHIGEYALNTLINRDFFGDLGLLDSKPRSATATAERDTLLLRLDQDAFYDLMAHRPEVARGVVQVLCNRIRAQDALITDMRNKLKSEPGLAKV